MNYEALVIIIMKCFIETIGSVVLVQLAVTIVVQLLVFIIVVICVDANGLAF